jgi:chromosome segregation ATPase
MSNFAEDSQQLSMIAPEPELIPEPIDEMSALEERILRAVEMVKKERTLRIAAEQKLAELESQTQSETGRVPALEAEVAALKQERTLVRQRIERLLKHLDGLSA